ncbi:riboflavin synthase [Helicobacter ailurogastricus]|uniref:Riboflavin synthase n=1 Tax=Helicobacter ailurogastricus TaxID=1578720 RepID=A0A0K2X439_9HELI|nr:riboflavin synthase [Helicobacter ailurogastricus]CRF41077.1 Riboflavin synthase eubacterial/eukaryotic [Helicobacter ailurogastricus]CRF42177.1 Riboflavin synthase eubacterial/eukaryotic [Helicobacter ailurogastricus]CRF44246.1 Riboflavin synthase eubacterial/eukaryotic [Helicobacter ailurogastricus]CRF52810.1 Riboflavin synthase eubacterial/eukaryotic [Helicobacter ailurogastricus]BDQ28275.1 riboflavin synthase subunit alpha [Helicobacter ailurogastricus]
MFSGLIQELSPILSFKGGVLSLKSKHRPKIGESIAVNGACLTVVSLFKGGFSVQMSAHTQTQIALENYQAGQLVHVEPALRAGDRFDGHFVQGHIDGVGVVNQILKGTSQVEVGVKAPPSILELCIPKGSIAIDGVSLTLAGIHSDGFSLVIIPHTFNNTLFNAYKPGRRVNIESDMLVRAVAHFNKRQKSLSWSFYDGLVMGY